MGKKIRRTQTRPKEGDGSPRISLPSTHLQSRDSRKKKKKTTPWVRLTWKKVLWGRNDETRHLALVLAHCVTFGKFLPLSEPQLTQLYNGDNMARPTSQAFSAHTSLSF